MTSVIFGVTGSISCGKSTVTKYFRKAGIPVVDADIVARQVVEKDSPGLAQVIETFGSEHLLPDGNLDRTKLGELVFHNIDQLEILNQIMSPLIQAESRKQLLALAQEHAILGYDASLLIEYGNADLYRPLVVVTATPDVQLARLMSRDNLTETQARARIDKQLSSQEKEKYADFIIKTDGTLNELEVKTLSVLSAIKAMSGILR